MKPDAHYPVAVIGTSKGIGQAIAQQLLQQGYTVIACSRQSSPAQDSLTQQGAHSVILDIDQDTSLEHAKHHISALCNDGTYAGLGGIINCVGILHTAQQQPEKHLGALKRDAILQSFNTNAIGHALVLQTFESLLRKSPDFFCVSLSAKVGSISDNRLGGWHSYRSSKAALNMLFKNIAIEWQRKYKDRATVLLIHPGTVDTELSRPFQKNVTWKLHTASEAAAQVIEVIRNSEPGDSGKLLDYNGEPIPF